MEDTGLVEEVRQLYWEHKIRNDVNMLNEKRNGMINEVNQRTEELREEGMEKGIEKVAINLLKLKQPINFIAKATELSESTIRNLQKTIM